MADVEFKDYTIEVQNVMNSKILAVLEEVSGELESQAKRNSRVATGQTKNSFKHKVVQTSTGSEAHIGSDYKNAIWEEFGTGEHALAGNGRKGGWVYVDAKGEGHFTRGKRPSRAFWNAFTALKGAIINRIKNSLKGM